MKTRLPCFNCEEQEKTVEVALECFSVRPDRFGTQTLIGCRQCVNRLFWIEQLTTGLSGWWSILGVVLTPLALLTNLVNYLIPERPSVLLKAISKADIPHESVIVGPSGLTATEANMRNALTCILSEMAWADGDLEEAEVNFAVDVATGVIEDFLPQYIEVQIRRHATPSFDPKKIEYTHRIVLFRIAYTLAYADGHFAKGEQTYLRQLGALFELPERLINEIMEGGRTSSNEWHSSESGKNTGAQSLTSACKVLHISEDATLAEAKKAYHREVMKVHPDRIQMTGMTDEEANEKTRVLRDAYETFVLHRELNPRTGDEG